MSADLNALTPEEQDFVIGLLYRAGIWVSHADDDASTEHDDELEAAALQKVLYYIHRHPQKYGAVIAQLAEEALQHTVSWKRWATQGDTFLADISKGVQILSFHFNAEEVLNFKRAMMLVGTGVAKSCRERADYAEAEAGVFGIIADKINSFMSAVMDRNSFRELNISPEEDTALNKLHQALASAR